jgi:hypothetical protein
LAPISSILVAKLTLVPAIRILYLNAFFFMTVKLLILWKLSTETRIGVQRKAETKGVPFMSQLKGYGLVGKKMLKSPGMLFAVVISILVEIVAMINMTFWQVIANKRIGIPDIMLPIFPMLRSVLAIFFFFFVISRMQQSRLKRPLLLCFLVYAVGEAFLVMAGPSLAGYALLGASLFIEALAAAALATLRESLVAIYAEQSERSRILALMQTVVMLVGIPFGYIGGFLSDISRALPFVLNIAILLVGALATLAFFKKYGSGGAEVPA